MSGSFCAFAVGAVGGIAVAAVDYLLLRFGLKRKPKLLALFYVLRQILNALYLLALYLLSSSLGWSTAALLLGGAAGLTLPSLFFTKELVKLNDAAVKGKKPEDGNTTEGKEQKENG